MIGTTREGGTPNVGTHSTASSVPEAPRGAGADVDQPAAGRQPVGDQARGAADDVGARLRGAHGLGLLAQHQRRDRLGRHRVQLRRARMRRLGRKLREVRRSIGAREASADITGMSYRRQIVTGAPAAAVAVALQKLRQGLTGRRSADGA